MILKKTLTTIIILTSAILAGCASSGSKPAEFSYTEEETSPVSFRTTQSSIDYLSGYWTDGKTDYISVTPLKDNIFMALKCNLEGMDKSSLCLVRDGTVISVPTDITEPNTQAEGTDILSLEYSGDNTLRATNLITGTEYVFSRDSLEVDETNLDDEYVFYTMNRAVPFLIGTWTDKDSRYVIIQKDESESIQWISSLSFPKCDGINFCDGNLCGVVNLPDGGREIIPAYSIHIKDHEHIVVTSLTEDFTSVFRREVNMMDEIENLDEYVFFNSMSTMAFLEGCWADDNGRSFALQLVNGQPNWKTTLLIERYDRYEFSGSKIYGYDSDGTEHEVIEIAAVDLNTITIRNVYTKKEYTLTRTSLASQENADEQAEKAPQ